MAQFLTLIDETVLNAPSGHIPCSDADPEMGNGLPPAGAQGCGVMGRLVPLNSAHFFVCNHFIKCSEKRLSVILTHTENYKVPYSVSRSMIKNTIEKSPRLQG